jgi:hypothetical protein
MFALSKRGSISTSSISNKKTGMHLRIPASLEKIFLEFYFVLYTRTTL